MATRPSAPRLRASFFPPIAPTDALAERARTIWGAGDFGRIAPGFADGAAEFVRRIGIVPGERVLDVACGTGNVALPAARLGGAVTGLDIVPALLGQARAAAADRGLPLRLDEGNCEALPYRDRAFDVTISMFGVMFAGRPDRAAAELLRVTRPGGRIALASWTPTGFVGELLQTVKEFVPPPAGIPSPLLWGHEGTVRARLADARALRFERRMMEFAYPCSPAETADLFIAAYGPTVRASAALDAQGRTAFRRALTWLWTEYNQATDGTTRVESEYLEVTGVR